MGIALSAAFILPDLPHNTRGFTQEELEVAQLRMTEDIGEADVDSEDQGPWDGLFMALKDGKIYIMMFTFTAYVVGLSFNAYFVSFSLDSWNIRSYSGLSLPSRKHLVLVMCRLCS